MTEDTIPTNEPWTEFDLKDLKKYFNEFSKEYAGKKLVKIIANKLRRSEDDVSIKLEECLPIWKISTPLKTIVVPQHSNGGASGIGVVIDDTSVLKADNKNLHAMNDLLKKEIQQINEEHRKKIQEMSNDKLALDPTKHYLRCPHCSWLWEIQRVIE